MSKTLTGIGLATVVFALVFFANRCGCGKSKIVSEETTVDSTYTEITEEITPVWDDTTASGGNAQLEGLLSEIEALQAEREAFEREARHEKGRHYKYKEDADFWRGKHDNLIKQMSDFAKGNCEERVRILTEQMSGLTASLRAKDAEATESMERFQKTLRMLDDLKEQLDVHFVNEFRDTLANGLVMDSRIETDGFVLRPGAYSYKLTGSLLSTNTNSTQTRLTVKKNSVAALMGLQPDGNFMYSPMYSRNGKVFSLYAQPIYFDQDNQFGFNGGFKTNNLGFMAGIGVNLR